MRAAWYEAFGPAPEVLSVGDLPDPEPAAGEVLVRLRASGVNPSDVKLRAGMRPGGGGMPFPRIVPQSDGAGTIEAVGEGVPASRVGERVWIWNGQWQRPFGTAAEMIALPAAQAVPLPKSASFEVGACLGIPAVTAHRAVHASGPLEGRAVLVAGGAGSVARYAIQMAKLGGATVITTVSGPEKARHAQLAGADHILNYREDDLVQAVMDLTGGKGVERIVDSEFGGNLPVSAQVIAPHGTITTYGSARNMSPTLPFGALMFKDVTIRMVLIYILEPGPRAEAERDLARWLERGMLEHAVAATFPLAEIAAAHELVESADKLGTVVVSIS